MKEICLAGIELLLRTLISDTGMKILPGHNECHMFLEARASVAEMFLLTDRLLLIQSCFAISFNIFLCLF